MILNLLSGVITDLCLQPRSKALSYYAKRLAFVTDMASRCCFYLHNDGYETALITTCHLILLGLGNSLSVEEVTSKVIIVQIKEDGRDQHLSYSNGREHE